MALEKCRLSLSTVPVSMPLVAKVFCLMGLVNKETMLTGMVSLFIDTLQKGGPDGIRTRDLGLDRAAC